ncbi:MAG: hypothetical protein U0U70_11785 [Chitinophagaceae bacterium]
MATIFTISTDIRCYRIKAASFPEGVLAAHQELHQRFAFDGKRKFFGISRPAAGGKILYWAAAEKLETDDPGENNVEECTIPAGEYYGTDITSFRKDIPAIGRTFRELLTHPRLDPEGFCLEWYFNLNDVRCLVPLKK